MRCVRSGVPIGGEVAPGELGRRVDGVAAAGAEEDARIVERRQVGEALGEIEGRAIGEDAERLVAGELAHLRHRGLDDLVRPWPTFTHHRLAVPSR